MIAYRLHRPAMLLQSFKSALRNLLRHRQNAFIIILSLAIAFAFSNLLLAFLLHELRTDSFHPKKDRIYRLLSDDPFGDDRYQRYTIQSVAQFLKEHYAEVEAVCTISTLRAKGIRTVSSLSRYDDVQLVQTDSSFFQLFNYPVVEGHLAPTPLAGIVLTEALARRVLNEPPYLGQVVEMYLDSVSHQLPVVAVVAPQAENTQLRFDGIVMGNYLGEKYGGVSLLLVREGTDVAGLADKMNRNDAMPSIIGPGKLAYSLELYNESYFDGDTVQPFEQSRSSLLVQVCGMVIGLLFFSAGFNFITLLVVGLLHRKKEIGLRKVLGASRRMLGATVGTEVGLYVVVSWGISVLLTGLLLPYFNTAFETTLTVSYLTQLRVLTVAIGAILLVGLLTTGYLSHYLWTLNTIKLLSEQVHARLRMNRGLFTLQFLIATTLIVCSSVIVQQMRYIQSKPLGFNRELLELRAPDEETSAQLAVLKNRLLQHSSVPHAALSTGNPVSGNWLVRYELEEGEFYSPYQMSGDEDLIETLGLTVVRGRSFQLGNPTEKVINETFARHFNMDDPIGEKVPGTEDRIVGVVSDFNVVSLKKEIPLFILSYREDLPRLLVDASFTPLSELLPVLQSAWKAVYPNDPFEYQLISDQLLAQHHEDTFFYRIVISFTIASILIGCFGLYGIASFTSQQRTPEIGIRKVLGASVSNLILLLSKDYFRQLLIAFAVAIPVANYFMNDWLQSFVYRIDITAWLLLSPGMLMLLIALLTISTQTLRAATRNPVDSLRDE